ncbi:MAG: rRNA maturation RNase YbeY [Longimicrobiales bacterium]
MSPIPPEGNGLIVQVTQEGGWRLPVALLEAGVRAVMAGEGVEEGEVSLTFLGDGAIRALNLKYLQKDHPTDVLAFSLHDPGAPPVGDVYVGYEQARRQAEELGIELVEELLRLAIHGTLHVMGHEHPDGEARFQCEMYRRQEEILRRTLGLDR